MVRALFLFPMTEELIITARGRAQFVMPTLRQRSGKCDKGIKVAWGT
jgi:hypothetical protein